ncbi:MAG: ABC transporter substrate-binding protein [Acidobacteriota bacterium]|nr:ABC transporter substrate-binding protein [Acidobacteriota bacterium]
MSRFPGPVRGHSLAALAAAVVVLAACGSSAAAPTRSAAAHVPRFPLRIQAANGTVRLATRPARIVSLSASATEDLYAVGAGKQVVAVDSYSTYPKRAPHTKLSAYKPNAEAIAKYRPDLVVISNDQDQIVAQLGKLRIPVLVEPAAANLAGVYGEIRQIGRATGHTLGAKRVVARMKRQIAAIVRSTPRPNPPLSVYHELDQTYYSADSHTFIGQLYSLLGLRNIADKASSASHYPQLSAEYIISANPDLIVLADTVCCGQTQATVAARPGWNTIKAVKTGMVVPVNDSIASEWGPRIVLFLKAVASAVKTLEAHG